MSVITAYLAEYLKESSLELDDDGMRSLFDILATHNLIVDIYYSDERGAEFGPEYVVSTDNHFWLNTFKTKIDAITFCNVLGISFRDKCPDTNSV